VTGEGLDELRRLLAAQLRNLAPAASAAPAP
jgi:hypothetical protein